MPIYYVYSPFTGNVVSLDCYCGRKCANNSQISCAQSGDCNAPCGCSQTCGKCNHTLVGGTGFCCPLDLGGTVDTVVKFKANSEIKSIKTVYLNGTICLSDTGDIDNGIKVKAYRCYNANGGYLGDIIYGHLKNRANYTADGQVHNKPPTGNLDVSLGQLVACCGNPGGCSGLTCFCCCYGSVHIHTECNGFTRSSMACGDQRTTSQTIYSRSDSGGQCPLLPE